MQAAYSAGVKAIAKPLSFLITRAWIYMGCQDSVGLHTCSGQARPPGSAAGWLGQIPGQRGRIQMICSGHIAHLVAG